MKVVKVLPAVGIIFLLTLTTAFGQFSFDENGGGFGPSGPISGFMSTDPYSGLLTLTYTLPFGATSGDVLLLDPETSQLSDVLRFGGNHLWFFSDVGDADMADVGLPPAIEPNNIGPFPETGVEGGFRDFVWAPVPGSLQPGDPGFAVTYQFISDIPEPSTLMLVGLSLTGLLAVIRRKN